MKVLKILVLQWSLVIMCTHSLFSNQLHNDSQRNIGTINYIGAEEMIKLTFWSIYGLFLLVPEYTVEFHEHDEVKHGLLWEVPVGFTIGPLLTVFSPAIGFFPLDDSVSGSCTYRIQLFPLVEDISSNYFLIQIGTGYFFDSIGHGPKGEIRIIYGGGNSFNMVGFFCSYSYVRDIKKDKNRYIVSAGIEYLIGF